ncbi:MULTISPECIES: hypothetical protein [Xanthomonas]|uniref:hypothetical protein n=1 Tax=Xanthomonas TaxID=338 RepID=UPI0012907FB6|nr:MULTISPECIES: hypothetical protein [Xanthomonas]
MNNDRECADKYSEQLGLTSIENLSIDEFLISMKLIASQFHGYFVIKVDGEREVGQYTFALNLIEKKGISIRRDVDYIIDGMEFIFSELYKNKIIF